MKQKLVTIYPGRRFSILEIRAKDEGDLVRLLEKHVRDDQTIISISSVVMLRDGRVLWRAFLDSK